MANKYQEAVKKVITKYGDGEEFNQAEYIKQFTKENYKHYHIMINKSKEDVIELLENQPSKNAYIISLIEKDLKRLKRNMVTNNK